MARQQLKRMPNASTHPMLRKLRMVAGRTAVTRATLDEVREFCWERRR